MTLDGIPEYPAFRKITLEDSISVKEMLARYPTEVSERTFGSVFMWRTYEDRSIVPIGWPPAYLVAAGEIREYHAGTRGSPPCKRHLTPLHFGRY